MELDDLRVVPKPAERLEHPDPLTYVATVAPGVRFHGGHPLHGCRPSRVCIYGQHRPLSFVSPRKGGYRQLESVTATDEITVVFPAATALAMRFHVNLMMPIVERGARPPPRFEIIRCDRFPPLPALSHLADDQVEAWKPIAKAHRDGAPKELASDWSLHRSRRCGCGTLSSGRRML